MEKISEFNLGTILGALWRQKLWIALAAIVAAAVAFYYTAYIVHPTYTARATVAIESRDQQITDLESVVSGLSAEQPSLNTEVHVIRSRQLLERLVIAETLLDDPEFNETLPSPTQSLGQRIKEGIFGPEDYPDYTQEQLTNRAIDRVLSQLSVVNPTQSYVFEIAFSADDPETAASVANSVASLYIGDQLLVKEAISTRAIEFLDARTGELQEELSQAELAVKDFAASTELVSPETLAAKNRQVKELRDRVGELAAGVASQESLIERLGQFDAASATLGQVEEIGSATLTVAFRNYRSGRLDLAGLNDAVDLAVMQTERTMRQNQTQQQSLQEAITALEAEIETQSQDLLTLQQLEREAEATREIYGYFLSRLKEAEVQQGTQQPDARLLSAAVVPTRPSQPRVMLMTAIIGILGALVASAVALLNELRDQGIRNSEDLADISEEVVFGEIPVAPFRRKSLVTYLAKRSSSAFSESIRNLRTSLELSDPGNPPKVVLITSSVPGEGKTTMSIALAANMAGLNRKVLLVEVDIRRRAFNHYFDCPDNTSLVRAVDDGALDATEVYHSEELGIDILPGGKSDLNAANFFSSEAFINLLSTAREQYDIVILDAPPVMAVPDARIIGPHVDRILFVSAWNSTPRSVVRSALNSLRSINLDVTGVVLSQIDVKKARKLGNSGKYGYYGNYGAGYYDA